MRFLSTLSLRRATNIINSNRNSIQFLSTLSLRRATSARPEIRRLYAISIHALLAESDNIRGALPEIPYCISIHALLAESDTYQRQIDQKSRSISIHALLAESDYKD